MVNPDSDVTNSYKVESLNCPSCGFAEAKFISHLMDISYYQDFLMVNIICSKCGFRSSDFYNSQNKGYLRYEYRITNVRDQSTKVVRASTGKLRIPELGIKIEPVNDGSSWIRNIEGILDDIRNKLLIMLRDIRDETTQTATRERIALLEKCLANEMEFTVIIEDETGNSIILPTDPNKISEFKKKEN